MRRKYWVKRIKPPSYLISDYSKPGAIEERYIQEPLIKFIQPPKKIYVSEPMSEEPPLVTVKLDCVVNVTGVACKATSGEVSIISRNEPTEALKNKKPRIHQQVVAYAPDLGTPSRYGGWVSPYEMVNRGRLGPSRIERKKKTYEYY